MALATLAGGPFGGWYYFGPRNEWGTGMVRLHLRPLFRLKNQFPKIGSFNQ